MEISNLCIDFEKIASDGKYPCEEKRNCSKSTHTAHTKQIRNGEGKPEIIQNRMEGVH